MQGWNFQLGSVIGWGCCRRPIGSVYIARCWPEEQLLVSWNQPEGGGSRGPGQVKEEEEEEDMRTKVGQLGVQSLGE